MSEKREKTNKTDPNHPAFPFEGGANSGLQPYTGMTIREYYAGLAMQGMATAQDREGTWASCPERNAEYAVAHADALIKELNKEANHDT